MQMKSNHDFSIQIPVREKLSRDHSDPWKVVSGQVFSSYHCLLILSTLVGLSCISCLWTTSVWMQPHIDWQVGHCTKQKQNYLVAELFCLTDNKMGDIWYTKQQIRQNLFLESHFCMFLFLIFSPILFLTG